ncbi:hypothetical protein A9Q83_02040 [Alphaproteobacteria bacterium 46_93_T64]|nr:hypothetical protein A9Q83_02040 [Alphaproteobacteria bacterium 46_93_T64]
MSQNSSLPVSEELEIVAVSVGQKFVEINKHEWQIDNRTDQLEENKVTPLVTAENVAPCFWTAWNNHREYLRRLSMIWMNIGAMDAEDALSDATIRAYEKYKAHAHHINNERAWFARLLHNICIDTHRSNKRRFRLGEKVKEVVTIEESTLEKTDLTPEGELLNSELGKSIKKAIDELPEKLRQPLIMRLVHGDEYSQISKILNISNDNARKRVQQARSILRGQLSSLRDEQN